MFAILFPSAAQAFDPNDRDSVLQGRDCPACDLSCADLFAKNLENINLSGANLSRAKFSLASLKGANLSRADLRGSEFSSAFWFGTNLSQANLSQAKLDRAYLQQANLEGAILAGANLSRAFFFDANLKRADLQGAMLDGANLSGTNLVLANLQQAKFDGTIYDAATRFPNGFERGRVSLTTAQSKSQNEEPPDCYNSRLAEIHQLFLERVIALMADADSSSYGGGKDQGLERAAVEVNGRLLKLKREIYGENPLENVGELLHKASINRLKANFKEAERLFQRADDS